jgi:hypothetical protein
MVEPFDMDVLRDAIRAAAKRAGFSISRLDRELRGEGGSLVKDFLAGRSKNPQVQSLVEIASVLDLSFYDVIGVTDQIQHARVTAMDDALLAFRALLSAAQVDPTTAGAMLRAVPPIAQEAQSAREAGDDVLSAVSALARHMLRQSPAAALS